MAVLLAGAAWACLIAWLILRAARQFRAHRALPVGESASAEHSVAIIVPARNEARNIGQCLSGLSAQRGLAAGSSIIVVDDGSRDGTADKIRAAAQNDGRIGLVEAGALPVGWMGKPYACW